MKNKKAILKTEVLKIIIAVLCLIILISLIVKLYGLFTEKSDLEKAKATLERIVEKIESLENEEKGDYDVLNPKGWFLTAYNEGENMPPLCYGKNCLCICPSFSDIGPDSRAEKAIRKCSEKGTCKNVDEKINIEVITQFGTRDNKFLEREKPANNKDGQVIVVENKIPFETIPLRLFIKKESNEVFISDVDFDTEIMNTFLNRDFGPITLRTLRDYILEDLFLNCSRIERSWWSGEPKIDEKVKKNIRDESTEYFIELMVKEEVKGGKVIFTISSGIFFNNILFVYWGDTSSCSLVEEKKICSKEIDDNTIRAYVRMYTCNQ